MSHELFCIVEAAGRAVGITAEVAELYSEYLNGPADDFGPDREYDPAEDFASRQEPWYANPKDFGDRHPNM